MAYGPQGSGLWRNPISYFGMVLATLMALFIAGLLVLDYAGGSHSTYLGILTFMVLPGFLAMGGGLFLYGMWREHRVQSARMGERTLFPVLDLNAPRQRIRFSLYML